ncbi:hypothetical protein DPEC_G00078050, partial [Dallia pectoralis]
MWDGPDGGFIQTFGLLALQSEDWEPIREWSQFCLNVECPFLFSLLLSSIMLSHFLFIPPMLCTLTWFD